jgi:predicted  nucleic acid-binding Zn-ribbon protein
MLQVSSSPSPQPAKSKEDLQTLQKRATAYEQDLNRARDEILTAQKEMKNIDSEVADFHSKMAKSMHSLLKAFTEGFEAMD